MLVKFWCELLIDLLYFCVAHLSLLFYIFECTLCSFFVDMGAVYVNALIRALNEAHPYAQIQDMTFVKSEKINRAFVLYWLRLAFNNPSVDPKMPGWGTQTMIDFVYLNRQFRIFF